MWKISQLYIMILNKTLICLLMCKGVFSKDSQAKLGIELMYLLTHCAQVPTIFILNKTQIFVLMCRGVSFKDTRDKLANWQIETIEARLRTSSLNNWLMVIANIAFSHLCFAPYLPEPAHVCYTFIKDYKRYDEVHSSPTIFF